MTYVMADRAPSPATDTSVRRAGLAAAFGLLFMSVLAGVSNFAVLERLITPGDPMATAADIADSETAFGMAILGLVLVVALDVVVAWGLFRVFSPVSHSMSLLAAWFRIVYSGVFLVAISQLVGVVDVLDGTAFTTEQRADLAMAKVGDFNAIWDVALLLFGIHLALIGWLAFRSGFVPKFLAVLLVIGGTGYLIDSVTAVLVPTSSIELSTVTFIGEFLLIFWLFFRAGRPSRVTS